MTLREMARRTEFSVAYLSDLELGRRRWSAKLKRAFDKALPRIPVIW